MTTQCLPPQVCYMGQDCSVGVGTVTSSGPGTRLKCAACRVVTHLACRDKLILPSHWSRLLILASYWSILLILASNWFMMMLILTPHLPSAHPSLGSHDTRTTRTVMDAMCPLPPMEASPSRQNFRFGQKTIFHLFLLFFTIFSWSSS